MSPLSKPMGLHMGREITGLFVEIYLQRYDQEFETKPFVYFETDIGVSIIDIRDDYLPEYADFAWVCECYDMLMKYWKNELTDEEFLSILFK